MLLINIAHEIGVTGVNHQGRLLLLITLRSASIAFL
jgi:hypothetical protein